MEEDIFIAEEDTLWLDMYSRMFYEAYFLLSAHFNEIVDGMSSGIGALKRLVDVARNMAKTSDSLVNCVNPPHDLFGERAEDIQCAFVTAYLCRKLELDVSDTDNAIVSAYIKDCGVGEKGVGGYIDKTQHPVFGYKKLVSGPNQMFGKKVWEAVLTHHEHTDGSGYPCGLEGGEIPVIAQVIRLAEIISAVMAPTLFYAEDCDLCESIDGEEIHRELKKHRGTVNEELYKGVCDIVESDPLYVIRGNFNVL